MVMDSLGAGIPQRLILAAVRFVHDHPQGLDAVAEARLLRLLFRPA